jgi:Zn-dependent protease with chaperone function
MRDFSLANVGSKARLKPHIRYEFYSGPVKFRESGVKSTVAKLFSTHPPLENGIAALEKNDYL